MPVKWDESFDVIVIGTGFAGLSAAIEACNSGASVLVLEKMKGPGGNSLISDGGVAAMSLNYMKVVLIGILKPKNQSSWQQVDSAVM